MHDIEPFYRWRDHYVASEDERSPFYGRIYDEFQYSQKIYNYVIHPQWDAFGSSTLYLKILQVDYDQGAAIFEMLGEWNDCIHNDVMFLKREVVDHLLPHDINKYVLICENVLNFHGDDDAYYEEWYEDVKEYDGWICFLNLLGHVEDEMVSTRLQHYVNFGDYFNQLNWRTQKPRTLVKALDAAIHHGPRFLTY